MNKFTFLLVLIISSLGVTSVNAFADENITELTVYTAKNFITMEPAIPNATAVAVANGKIVSVGSLESLKPWTEKYPTTFDHSLKNKIVLPGFIDPHIHPSLPAVLTLFPFISPEEWQLPTGHFVAAENNSDYLKQLKKQVKSFQQDKSRDKKIPFITWGYHQLWHGDIYRQDLDKLFPDTPVILWHRSFHELIANSTAIKLLDIQEKDTKKHPVDIDWAKGLFTEFGAKTIFVPKLMPLIMTTERYSEGMGNFVEMLHLGGITTAMDMGIGVFGNAVGEFEMIKAAVDKPEVPSRIVLTPIITDFIIRNVPPEEALAQVEQWQAMSSEKVSLDKHFKLMMDGAAFSGLGQMNFPGYLDGHKGVWMAPLETTYAYAKVFWNAGYQLHAHTNGDKSTDALIDIVARLQKQKSRVAHRTVLEHFMYATDNQLQQLAELDIAVSANTYYQYLLADMYATNWLGEDRARNMVPIGAAKRAGVKYAFHSDSPMAPLSPLTLAWAAVNRVTVNGNLNAQTEVVTVEDAMKAITINAAWMMRKENEIGSIRAGKKADFVVLEESPFDVDPAKLKDIKIWGTVFEGKAFPIKH
jgi:predicted amidohydrolase YtcJ